MTAPYGIEQRLGKSAAYIDSARGIAILLVILVHTAQCIEGLGTVARMIAAYAQVGVQLFFVASAWTLCMSHQRRAEEAHSLINFYIRRYFRIAPLYYLAILIYYVVFTIFEFRVNGRIKSATQYHDLKNIIANVLFLHSFYSPANNNIVPGGWSIGVEMVFYSMFPICFVILDKARRSGRFVYLTLFSLALLANCVCQFLLEIYSGKPVDDNEFALHFFTSQLPVFLIGISAYFIEHESGVDRERKEFPLSVLAFLGTFVAGFFLSSGFWNRSFLIVPSLVAFSFVYLLRCLAQLPNSGFLQSVGRVSYSMYIFHFLFAWGLVPAGLRLTGDAMPPTIAWLVSYVLSSSFAYLLATQSERFVERPGIRLGARIIRRIGRKEQPQPGSRTLEV